MLEIQSKQKKSAGRRLLWLSLGSLFIGVAGALVYLMYFQQQTTKPQVSVPRLEKKPTVKKVESKLLVMGDVFWGRYINDWSQASPQKMAYPFQRLNEFERDKYDAWVADLECPVTNNPKVSSAVEDDTLQFDCSPEYLPEAKKWFTAFTLANNHTDNQGGQAGLDETRQHLEENGIQNFGTFEPEDHDSICNVLSIPTQIILSDNTKKQGSLPMAWCGYHGVFKTPTAESIAVMKRYSAFPVIAMPHSGAEYKPAPDEIKTSLYRAIADGGADVVIGDHPHWVQNTEAYKGKLIVYSLGNFIFDQQYNTEVTRSALLDMTVSLEVEDSKEIDKWLALGEKCRVHADDCLAKVTEQQLSKLPLKYHFAVKGGNNSDKLVKPMTATELVSLKERLNWTQTIAGLDGQNSGE